jgi:hypothetical protein
MHRSKFYALTVLALLAIGAIVSVQANNGVIAPRAPDQNGLRTNNLGGHDGPPFPLSPQCGSKGGNVQPELVVSSMESGTYNFRVYRNMSNVLVAETYTDNPRWIVTTVAGPNPGLPPGTYSWTCRVNPLVSQPEGWSEFFEPNWTFEITKFSPPVDPVTPPTPISPPSGSKGGNRNPELVVLGLADAEQYDFRVYSVVSKSTAPIAEGYTGNSHWVVTTPVQSPVRGLSVGDYFWTCRVNMQGSWSEFFRPNWTFSIQKYEPPADGAVGSETPWDPTIQPRTNPNPFGAGGTRIQMALPRNTNASAAVYSTEGRLVRKLNMSRGPGGLCEFPWDGKDETGCSVGAGTYLCQITAGDMHKVVELVKSR